MNWTAILALLCLAAVFIAQHLAIRDANERAAQAWKHADEYAKEYRAALDRSLELTAAVVKQEYELIAAKALTPLDPKELTPNG